VPLSEFEHAIVGESSRAFGAFVKYRDLGPLRSIDAVAANDAVAPVATDKAKRKRRAAGVYNRWSSQHHWVERAAAYDVHVEDARMRAHEQCIQALAWRRAKFEFTNQERLEERVSRTDLMLDKFDSAPVTDVTQEKTETTDRTVTRTRSKIKGINGSSYAALLRERNDTARQAIVGVRPVNDKSKDPGEKNVDAIVWEPGEAK
jgi:hypothetical protein